MANQLKIAVIGAGRWGPNLIRNFQRHRGCSLRWIVESDASRLDFIQKSYPGVHVTQDWGRVLAQKDVDAVVIATPTATHYHLSKLALENGKHVLVEKPLTTKTREAFELVGLAEKNGLKLMVGHVFLFHPAIQELKRVLERGELGTLHYLYTIRTNLGPIRADVNALWDLAPHDLAVICYLLDRMPQEVTAIGSSFVNPPLEDVVFASLRFPQGVLANLHVSWLDPKKVRSLVVVGSKKMLVFDDMSQAEPLKIYDKNVGPDLSKTLLNDTIHLFRRSIVEGEVNTPKIAFSEPLQNECNSFVDWVVHDIPQISTGEFGAGVVTLLEKIEKSMKRGRPLRSRGRTPRRMPAYPSYGVALENL